MADEYVCPICLNVMIEPVTLPCSHGLCKACLESTLTEASMQCPICRYRLSTWVRRTRKRGGLVNEEKWQKIQELFADYVREKLSGNLSVELTEAEEHIIRQSETEDTPHPMMAAPGDLRREYEHELERLASERAEEQSASLTLIRELEEEERELWSARQSICEADAELARKLQSTPASPTGPTGSAKQAVAPTSSSRSKQRQSWLDRFMAEKQRLGGGAGSADSIGPELGPQFRPIETFPLSPSKSGIGGLGASSVSGRDVPLRPRALPTEASKENVCSSPAVTRQRSRVALSGAVGKVGAAKAGLVVRRRGKAALQLATSEGTAFRPVGVKKGGQASGSNMLERMKRQTQEERDLQMARELQRRFDWEHRLNISHLRYVGEEDGYNLRQREREDSL